MDRYKTYYEKKKEYKNAYKRLKYKLDTKKITSNEYNKELSTLKAKYSINSKK
jgi:hypothetical protein